MKEIIKKIEENKLLLTVPNSIYEKEAILNASYKYTDKCYINIEPIETITEIYFQKKNESINLESIALDFGNELIDQQIRLTTGREYKVIREELVKKAFSSISK
ncbi:MAG TPA: His-Xaa-Ser system protein HxsD [Bacteroidales bacterium]|nr:MAG: His-Xaa-Ser system protein HxsD [Bacteroidetes bacterium GWF2_35_48]OFZ00069.1 MAG: His-Xaa-Ser system protein HxsD [Bacteroidetes bacterium RIFOXYC12_FULL_35_7]HBX51112.1 His-Xaa-Ser system protein HxsD [Bacteroidales bacterium]